MPETDQTTDPVADLADNLAPHPETADEVTFDGLLRHETVHAFIRIVEFARLGREVFNPNTPADSPVHKEYFHTLHRAVAEFSTAFLLRALREHAPDKADEVARGLWEAIDGCEIAEILDGWLTQQGITADQVEQIIQTVDSNLTFIEPTATT